MFALITAVLLVAGCDARAQSGYERIGGFGRDYAQERKEAAERRIPWDKADARMVGRVRYAELKGDDRASVDDMINRNYVVLQSDVVAPRQLPFYDPLTKTWCAQGVPPPVDGFAWDYVYVSQPVSDTLYLSRDQDRMVEFEQPIKLVEGQSPGLCISRSNGTYDYVTVMGANRRIPLFYCRFTRKLDANMIAAHFQKGGAFVYLAKDSLRCPGCRGLKYAYSKEQRKRVLCDLCAGDGKVDGPRVVTP